MNRPKILIIGAGMVGSSSAASIAGRGLGEVFLYDMDEGLCLGRAMDIGTHDDNMIPLMSHATISGIPLVRLLSTHDIEKISTMTRTAGSTIVNLMKSHSGHYAAGEVIAQIVESMAMDRGMIFPLSACLNGEYGYRDTCLALPCVVDSTGVRKVIELNLNDQERASLETCARTMKAQTSSLKELLLS